MLVIELPLFILTHGGIWFFVGGRVLCAALAYSAIVDQYEAGTSSRRCERLLNEAARLEKVDRRKAIVVYGQIIKLFPDTFASKEAARNIEVLERHL